MKQKKVVYIAGPISGVPDYWRAFDAAEDELSKMGFVVLSPARLPEGLGNERAMKVCLAMLEQADAVYLLPGWKESTGASLEVAYCKYTGKPRATKISSLEVLL